MHPKNRFLTLAISEDDLATLSRAAATQGLTRSEYCRRLLLRGRPKAQPETPALATRDGQQ